MAHSPDSKPMKQRSFRQRYDDIEARRAELVARLRALGTNAQAHPGYKRAMKLLNETFRKSKLAQRLAVLQAAAWLIDILERLAEIM
jgi:predicted RNA polymerase sigma factor